MRREGNRLILQLPNRVLFDSGSATAKPEGLDVLRSLGRVLRTTLKHLTIQIGGHTDNSGNESKNYEISKKRANVVQKYLDDNFKISKDRLKVAYHGQKKPRVPNSSEKMKELNRRVDFTSMD